MLSEARLTKILGLENVCKQKNANHVQKKINCNDKIPRHFPDIGQMSKIPTFFQNSLTIFWPGENFVFPWHVATLYNLWIPTTL